MVETGKIRVWCPFPGWPIECERVRNYQEAIPRHIHELYQILYLSRGAVRFLLRDDLISVEGQRLLLIEPSVPHGIPYVKNSSGFCCDILKVGASLFRDAIEAEEAASDEGGPVSFPEPSVPAAPVKSLLQSLFDSISKALHFETIRYDLESVLISLSKRFGTRSSSPHGMSTPHDSIQKAMEYIRKHYGQSLTLQDMARHVSMKKYHFANVFQERTGITPGQFLTNYRIIKAKKQLLEGVPLADIANRLGFSDRNHLSRHFKRLVGVPPEQYRKDSLSSPS